MENFTLIAALLCTFSWISVSVSDFLTVKVQPGEEVTLMCNNSTSCTSSISWYRLTHGTNVSCIASMFNFEKKALLCDRFKNRDFNMTSNITNLFLNIKSANVSDTGLYFCGCSQCGPSALVGPTYLIIQGSNEFDHDTDCTSQKKSDESSALMGVILGGLTVFLVMVIIGQVVKIKKLQKADQDKDLQPRENLGSDDLNYATVRFAKNGRRRELEPNVVYAATR